MDWMLRRVLLWFLLALPMAPAGAGARDVAIGVFAYQGEHAAVADWQPLLAALSQALPGQRFHLQQYDAAGLRRAVAAGEVALVVTNPGYYIALESEFGLGRIATLSSAIGSVVLTRASRDDINSYADLAGKRIAAVAPDAFAGYLIAAREMLEAGVDPEADLAQLRFVGLPMLRTIEAIMDGEVDAGIVKACMVEQMMRDGLLPADALKPVGARQATDFPCMLSTRLYPDWPIAVTRNTDRQLAKDVARALLATPEWAVAADYQPVHELYQAMRLGPYAYLRDISPRALALKFWRWIAAALALLLLLGLHTMRVRQLVTRRTRQLHAAERRARDKQEQLDHMGRLSILGELSGNLAHEINQPLSTIGTYARSLLRRQAAGKLTTEALTAACGDIASEADRAGGIIQRIRGFARKRPSARAEVDLGAVAVEAVRLMQAPQISIQQPPPAGVTVHADGLQVQQVLLNLLKNAVDATRALPAQRQPITIAFETTTHHVITSVTDQGCGMDAASYPQLFDAFFTTKPDGLGLGLSICKSIIETHGGQLWAEMPAERSGMRFLFSLPLHSRQP